MMSSKYKEIENAIDILGLPESATMDFIKQQYKKLSIKWHPDKCREAPEKCHEMMQKINKAYDIIIDYCSNYKYSFKREDISKTVSPEELWYERFGNDPVWGRSKESDKEGR